MCCRVEVDSQAIEALPASDQPLPPGFPGKLGTEHAIPGCSLPDVQRQERGAPAKGTFSFILTPGL